MRYKTNIGILCMLLLASAIVFLSYNVLADETWTVDTLSQWTNAEDEAVNVSLNLTGIYLSLNDWHTVFGYAAIASGSGSTYTTVHTGVADLSLYDKARFYVEVQGDTYSTGYPGYCTWQDTGYAYFNGSDSTLSKDGDGYTAKYVNISAIDYGAVMFQVKGEHYVSRKCGVSYHTYDSYGYGKNWSVQGANYSTIGYWNSTWHDWGANYVLNNINFSINDTGGGISYRVMVSDDGVTAKDMSDWESIAATGYVLKYPVVELARYIRICFNLTRGSTPLIDGFIMSASENSSPSIDSTYPVDGTQGVSTALSQINVSISDLNGDTFNWSIETSPDIGDSSGNTASNGTKTCSVSGLVGGTTYTVYVNITDIAGNVVNDTFTFTTFGSVEFWCFDENNPSTGLSFGIEITNSHFYVNYSLSNGASISIADLPYGDEVIFVVNSTGYLTRTYTYSINAVDDYNFTFYLPPAQDDEVLKTTSSSVTDPDSDLVLTLDCTPSYIISIQGWNESLYGHWFEIPEDKYDYSGVMLTVNESCLDDNTSLVKVTYYCDEEYAVQYMLTVYGPQGEYGENPPIDGATVYVKRYISVSESYENISVVITDGNGHADVYLVPNILYKFIIVKDGYDNETVNRIPMVGVSEIVFRLNAQGGSDPMVPVYDNFWLDITLSGTLYENDTLYVVFYDANSSIIDTDIYIYDFYNGSLTYIDSDSRSGEDSFGFWVDVSNASHDHRLILFFNTSANYDVVIPVSVIVYGVDKSWSTDIVKFDLDERFTDVFGEFTLGYANTITIVIALICLALFGPMHVGIGVITCGLGMLLMECILYVYTVNQNIILLGLSVFIVILGLLYSVTIHAEEQL